MLIRKTIRYRAYPNEAQVARLTEWEGALRFLWNLALEQRLLGLQRSRPLGGKDPQTGRPFGHDERVFPSAFDQMRELTPLRAELPWLADVPRDVSGQLLVELDKAWQRCFKKLACAPRWKRKGRGSLSFCETDPTKWRLGADSIRFPKLGNMRVVVHRPIEGVPKSCTLTREGELWFANILCAIELVDPVPRSGPVVAIDRGLAYFGATSDGEAIANPSYLARALPLLRRAQRTVSRRKRGSKNQKKAQARVRKINRKVRRRREHFLHVKSARLAKSHGVIVLEKLNVVGMIRVGGQLARGIIDAGWSRFAEMLRYKLAWSGGSLVEVPAAYSSQTCSACGVVDAASRRSQSVFDCTSCGYTDHADLNAAKVLLTRANRSGMPGDGTLLEGAGRTRKRVKLRVPRTRCTPERSGL